VSPGSSSRFVRALFLFGSFAFAPLPGVAQSGASAWLHDIEIDPVAYALNGYSVHVALGPSKLRVDLGAYAMALPEVMHGNEDFEVSFDGFGANVQYFPSGGHTGGWVGLGGAVIRTLVERRATDLADRQRSVHSGVSTGWRFDLGRDFFINPWVGVGYLFHTRDVTLGGSTYEPNRITVFPAVHLGYRVR